MWTILFTGTFGMITTESATSIERDSNKINLMRRRLVQQLETISRLRDVRVNLFWFLQRLVWDGWQSKAGCRLECTCV